MNGPQRYISIGGSFRSMLGTSLSNLLWREQTSSRQLGASQSENPIGKRRGSALAGHPPFHGARRFLEAVASGGFQDADRNILPFLLLHVEDRDDVAALAVG